MSSVRACDCCGSTRSVLRCALEPDGVKTCGHRQVGGYSVGADLCESCRVSLAFHWGQLKNGELKVKAKA